MITSRRWMERLLARPLTVNDGDEADAWEEFTMQSQSTSLIMLAEVRQAELQAEAAQERFARQALNNGVPATSVVAGLGRRLGITLASTFTLLHVGLTFLRAH
jgi:hypothetical protein